MTSALQKNHVPSIRFQGVALLLSVIALVAACGNDTSTATGIRVAPVADAAEVFENQPDDLVVLDVRTPDEFNAGHLDGAIMIDFYEADFRAQIAELDRDVPYLLYCRSGNRSGSTADIMADLGFSDVIDIDGGINAWQAAGQPVTG